MRIYLKKFVWGQLTLIFALGCFAFSPTVRAVDPAPDGGYPNQNTPEKEDALFSLTTGADNTAMGFDALHRNTTGSDNAPIELDLEAHRQPPHRTSLLHSLP